LWGHRDVFEDRCLVANLLDACAQSPCAFTSLLVGRRLRLVHGDPVGFSAKAGQQVDEGIDQPRVERLARLPV
jgi:hypothetical protein